MYGSYCIVKESLSHLNGDNTPEGRGHLDGNTSETVGIYEAYNWGFGRSFNGYGSICQPPYFSIGSKQRLYSRNKRSGSWTMGGSGGPSYS